jgi:hypothetical protein
MSRNRDDWLVRIKAVERQHLATRIATDRLLQLVHRDSTILLRPLKPADIGEASDYLEATYSIRLFAEFESGLRHFWGSAKRTRTEHLLNGVAAERRIPQEWLANAHIVRQYRNKIVHEQEGAIEAIPIATARGHLCRFFSYLPPIW